MLYVYYISQQPKGHIMKPQPLFSMTTAYKTIMDLHRQNNNIYALVVYVNGDHVIIYGDETIDESLCGVEKYEFSNSKYCDLGANLFDKVIEYENFLCTEVVDNQKVQNASQPFKDAFRIKYKEPLDTWWKRFLANLSVLNNKERQVTMNPYEKNTVWSITKDVGNLIGFETVRPVFKSAYQQSSNNIVYVYELELIKAINMQNVYSDKPCIKISLFDNSDMAKQYVVQSVLEQQEFKKHKAYPELRRKCTPAVIRFDKFTKTKNMSR